MLKIAAALPVLALALAGCGGSSGGTPRALPTLSSSPPPVASPTPTGMSAPTPEGAAEFAKYVYAQIEKAFATNNPQLIKAVSLPDCVACMNFIRSVTTLASTGGRVTGYRIHVTTAVAPAVEGGTATVTVLRNSTDNVEYDKSGRVVSREKGLTGIEEEMDLRQVDGSWRVAKILRIRVRG